MKTFTLALTLLTSSAAFAWGPTGHRAVGEIATKFLHIDALVRANKILKGASLARVSTWPDEIRSEPTTYSHTYVWHYTTWQTDAHDHSGETETNTTGFLLKSINEHLAVLKDPAADDDKKAFSLKFLVHLIGDLHQPLHVGNGTDQGGNFCKVVFQGKPTNLHALWDEGMIDFTNLSFTELAKMVSEGKQGETIRAIRSGNAVDWALESKNLVPSVYPVELVPSTDPNIARSYCKREVLPEEMPKLSYEYSYRFMPIVERRIYEAGVRLAWLINENLK